VTNFLHQMLRVLVPQRLCPHSLDRFGLSDDLNWVVLEWTSSVLLIDFLQPLNDVFLGHVHQRLVLNIAIYVGWRHVRMVVPLHVQLEVHVRILFKKTNNLRWLKRLSNSEGASWVIAEIQPYVFQLGHTSTHHYF
jgi:hypothetical protein